MLEQAKASAPLKCRFCAFATGGPNGYELLRQHVHNAHSHEWREIRREARAWDETLPSRAEVHEALYPGGFVPPDAPPSVVEEPAEVAA